MAEWHFDSGYHFDASEGAIIEGEMDLELSWVHTHRPFDDLFIEGELGIEVDWIHAVSLNLLRLIPLMYHDKAIFTTFIDEVELEVGSWLTSIRDMVKLLNPNSVARRSYLKNLASLVGLSLPPEDDSTEDEIRRSISQAIDWYKIKGTYQSLAVIAFIQKFTTNIYDMYTDSDYSDFYLVDWFVGGENENPSSYPYPTYFKSPHFAIEILLDQTYSGTSGSAASVTGSAVGSIILESGSGGGSTAHLWRTSYLDNFYDLVELTRPVHTVPHYILFLNPKTDEFGHVIEVSGDIQTKVLRGWEFITKYFDSIADSSPWYFDDESTYFDESTSSFINSITTWVLGTGNANINSASWVPDTPVLTGTIDSGDIVIDDEKVSFSFIVPTSTEQEGIRELALYTSDNEIVLGSVFPAIDKGNRVELKVTVEVYKEDLRS
jgi:hypothetical protein